MTNEQLKSKVLSLVPTAEITEAQYLNVTVSPEELHLLAQRLRDDEDTRFDYLMNLTGVDWGKALGVVYHLTSTFLGHFIVLKTQTEDRENGALDTVCDLWKTAELQEREVFEMFGIKFNNHPDLRILLLPEHWVGFPLRKDYVDDVNMISK